jgi:hypothetical protein
MLRHCVQIFVFNINNKLSSSLIILTLTWGTNRVLVFSRLFRKCLVSTEFKLVVLFIFKSLFSLWFSHYLFWIAGQKCVFIVSAEFWYCIIAISVSKRFHLHFAFVLFCFVLFFQLCILCSFVWIVFPYLCLKSQLNFCFAIFFIFFFFFFFFKLETVAQFDTQRV